MFISRVSKRQNILLIVLALAAGVLFDYLFYKSAIGISMPIFVLFAFIIFFVIHSKIINYKAWFAWFLLVVVLLLSATFAVFSNQMLMGINLLAIILLFASLTIIFTENNSYKWYDIRFVLDLFPEFFVKTLENIIKPFNVLLKLELGNQKGSNVKKIILGIVISIPLIIVILILLSSADAVFENYLGKFPEWLEQFDIASGTAHVVIVSLITILTAAFSWALLHKASDHVKHRLATLRANGDAVVASTVLVLVNLVYLVFVIVQFSYLFGGGDLSFLGDHTYSEYARRGFGELIAVTIINLTVLLIIIHKTSFNIAVSRVSTKVFSSLLVVFSTVILYSSHFRLALYEEAYGFTIMRMLPHLFVGFLLILFVITLVKIWNHNMSVAKYYILAGLIVYVAINWINIDFIVAKKNVERFNDGKKIDVRYFDHELSYDALPLLIPLLQAEEDVASDARAVLKIKYRLLEKNIDEEWQSYNLSKSRVREAIELSGMDLEETAEDKEYERFRWQYDNRSEYTR